MKTVVLFQGGGALGAFGAGAWQALLRQPGFDPADVVAVAGASVGALNAAAVAHHHAAPDGGAAELQALWMDRMATPSWPFFGAWPLPLPPSGGSARDWNGFITGVLLGVRGLSHAAWPGWQPLSGLSRLQQPLHDRQPMWRLLQERYPAYDSRAADGSARRPPMLAVAAVDVMAGTLSLFDSDTAPLTALHLAASSAMPLVFDPVSVDDRLHWDGEATRDSLLPLLLQRLLTTRRVRPGEPLRLVTLEQFPRALALPPNSGAEMAYRALGLMQQGKLDAPDLPYIRIANHLRVQRQPLPEDGVSGQFDFSPARIARLMQQGRDAVPEPERQPLRRVRA